MCWNEIHAAHGHEEALLAGIFEPILVAIALFSALFFVNGLLLATLMDRFHAEPEYTPRLWGSRVAAGLLLLVALAGGLGLVGTIFGLVEDEGTCLRAAGRGEGCAVEANQ